MNNSTHTCSGFDDDDPLRNAFREKYSGEIREYVEKHFSKVFEKLTDETEDQIREFKELLLLRQMLHHSGLNGHPKIELIWKHCSHGVPSIRKRARKMFKARIVKLYLKRLLRFGPEINPEMFTEAEQNEIKISLEDGTLESPVLLGDEKLLLSCIRSNPGQGKVFYYKISGLGPRRGVNAMRTLETLKYVNFLTLKGDTGRPKESVMATPAGIKALDHCADGNQD